MLDPMGEEALVRALAEERVPPEPAEVVEARRERVVGNLAHTIRAAAAERGRRARYGKWFFVAAAAAVVLGVGLGFSSGTSTDPVPVAKSQSEVRASVRSMSGELLVVRAGQASRLPPGSQLDVGLGDEVSTAAGTAELRTERGRVHLTPETRIRVLALGAAEERVGITEGRIDVKVSKRPEAPQRVVIQTPDSEVVVRGTVFTVAIEDEGGHAVTRVHVTEGTVWVGSEGARQVVRTGREWRSEPERARLEEPPAQPEVALERVRTPQPARAPARASRDARKAVTKKASSGGTLGEENRLFTAAVEARNGGDDRRAAEVFGLLLSRYPKSQLAEEARLERMRALRRVGDVERAAAEARRYLSDHEAGFARDEARRTALGED